MKLSLLAFATAGIATVAAQATQSAYGQCGGRNWTGLVNCPTGWKCKCQNEWYSQCVNPVIDDTPNNPPGCGATSTAQPTSTTVKPPTTTLTTSVTKTSTSTTLITTTTSDNNGPITITRSVSTRVSVTILPTGWP